MTTWVKSFDQSFQRVPIANYPAMYAAGYRVMMGYVAGGSSDKHTTAEEIAAWFMQGSDTGFGVLFEGIGTEAVNDPTLGDDHAKATRAGCRALGIPDHVGASPAVDENVNTSQWMNQLVTYFQHWNSAEPVKATPYVEADAGEYLFGQSLTGGTFTPAAYAWNAPAVLYTPSNAPSHVTATQEKNGQNILGGNVDIGHVRSDATFIYWNSDGGIVTPAEALALLNDPGVKGFLQAVAWQYSGRGFTVPNVNNPSSLSALNAAAHAASGDDVAALSAKIDALTAAVATLQSGTPLASTTPVPIELTPDQLAAIAKAVLDEQHNRDAA